MALAFVGAYSSIAAPPVAPVRMVADDYHGVKIGDPYRYFENFTDPEVQAWVKAQAQFADQTLQALPGRDALLERIRDLDTGAPYRISILHRWPNGDLHYLKTMAEENLEKLYFKDAKTGAERLLVDSEKRSDAGTGKHVSIEFARPSPDGRYVAYGLAASGSEQTTLHILDTLKSLDLPEKIERLEADYTLPYWLPDSSGFVYCQRRQLAVGSPATEGYKRTRACLHRLGTAAEDDPVLFAMGVSDTVAMAETDFPSLVLASGSKYIIGKIKHGDTDELTLFAAPLDSALAGNLVWKKICDPAEEVRDFAVHGEDIDLLTTKNAPHGKVVRTALANPEVAKAQIVLAPGEAILQRVWVARDGLYVGQLEAGLGGVVRIPFDPASKPSRLRLPASEQSAVPTAANPDVDGVLISTDSWTRAGKIYSYDPASNSLTDTLLKPRGKFDDVEGYESAEVQVSSHDGTKVPLSIIYKAGIKLDGSHPTLVNGYGSYGMSLPVRYSPNRIAWLEGGGVLAFAHVRGGGELGKEWHHGGRQSTKPNTWKDFIACCEYLVGKGYTSPAKLAGEGGSAGGILIGRAITERPELFAAAIIGVGCTDLLRMETTTNGVPNIAEFGTVTNVAGFKALLEMSPYEHAKSGVNYPAVLLTHGINDPRVEPWMSAKMTARLQAATASDNPILFRVDYDAGHGMGSTKIQRQKQLADEWAFLLWRMK